MADLPPLPEDLSNGLPPPPPLGDILPPPPIKGFNDVPPPPSPIPKQRRERQVKPGPDPALLHHCSICKESCSEIFYVACGEYFHPNCFKCEICHCHLKPPNCVSFRGHFLCFQCSEDKGNLKQCNICEQFLYDYEEKVKIPGKEYSIHASCFVCYECSEPLKMDTFTLIEDKLLCAKCIAIFEKRKCANCNKFIFGRYIQCRGKFFHPEHFLCCECNEILCGNCYVVHHDKYYCPLDGQYFTGRCSYCKKEIDNIEGSKVDWHNKVYHKRCFVCRVCGARCDPENCKSFHERPHCDECYKKRIIEEKKNANKHNPNESSKRRKNFKDYFDKKEFVLPIYSKDTDVNETVKSPKKKKK
ncbi:LIM domain containing protein [Histomonas meleagridis]|uniref:LIM domain containing protein n=1 Tax=Histomonas meleagridis TaxID=135588 RepID=UPI0035595912|nr:LIM domain containing protein [Histomonas meleagridis]KAH0801580.1 LIM domain containing protein [Histomonas meleagridis]